MGKQPTEPPGSDADMETAAQPTPSTPESVSGNPTEELAADPSKLQAFEPGDPEEIDPIHSREESRSGGDGLEKQVVAGLYQTIAKLEVVQHQLKLLQQDFDIKLREDHHKEKIIDGLHQELQEYKSNIFSQHQHSMAMDVIKIMDDIRKFIKHYRGMKPDERDLEKILDYLEQLPADIEDMLGIRGITPYQVPSDKADPSRQRISRTISTDTPFIDRLIAARLRPG